MRRPIFKTGSRETWFDVFAFLVVIVLFLTLIFLVGGRLVWT